METILAHCLPPAVMYVTGAYIPPDSVEEYAGNLISVATYIIDKGLSLLPNPKLGHNHTYYTLEVYRNVPFGMKDIFWYGICENNECDMHALTYSLSFPR